MKHKIEQFNDYIARLFPDENYSMTVSGNHVYNITFQVTDYCNLNCTYCYQHNKTPAKMNFETAKKFIDLILAGDERSNKYINSYNSKGVILEFIGGEPLLEITLISQITEYFLYSLMKLNHPWLHRFRISFSTNGTLYFEPEVQEYINKYQQFLSFTITIDGNKELHDTCRLFPDGSGSYDIAHKAALDWRKRVNVDLTKITVSPYNVDKIADALIYLIQEEAYDTIFINCVYEEGWTKKEGKILYEQLKYVSNFLLDNDLQDEKYITILDDPCGQKLCDCTDVCWCGGSGLMICLDPRGDIYPCLRYAPNSVGEEKAAQIKIGDVEHGFVYNQHQEEIIESFKQVTRQSQLACHENCKNCPIQEGCGDCAAYSYEVSGKIGYRTDYHCITHIARNLIACYFKNKSYLKTQQNTPVQLNVPQEWALKVISLEEYNLIKQITEEALQLYGTIISQ